jgi:crossover junction endodeoxyribonuclease RuvC
MIILGIDPGTARTGYGIIEKKGNSLRTIKFGLIETSKDAPQPERLGAVHDGIVKLIRKFKPDAIAVEKLFFNKNAKTVMSISESRGVILLAAVKCGIGIFEYTPLQVKMALTGYGMAQKGQVERMTRALLNLKEIPKPDDIADALAIAVCGANSYRMDAIKKNLNN